jgi:hypothetical protein
MDVIVISTVMPSIKEAMKTIAWSNSQNIILGGSLSRLGISTGVMAAGSSVALDRCSHHARDNTGPDGEHDCKAQADKRGHYSGLCHANHCANQECAECQGFT